MKNIILIVLICLMSNLLYSKPIDESDARKIAEKFFYSDNSLLNKNSIKLEHKRTANVDKNNDALQQNSEELAYFYIYNFGNNGFLILSGDDAVYPILGYSHNGSFDYNNMPPALEWWLKGYEEQIKYVIENNIEAIPEIQNSWEKVRSTKKSDGENLQSDDKKEIETAHWGQGRYYNFYCPTSFFCGLDYDHKSATGCVATAMGIIMKKWSYPEKGKGGVNSYSYLLNTHSINYDNAYYHWGSMPSEKLTSYEFPAIPNLLYHLGVSVFTEYDDNLQCGSNANGPDVITSFKKFYGYDTLISLTENSKYNRDDWVKMLKNEINNKRLIFYGAQKTNKGGHAFILDGYDDSETFTEFRINWGWNGLGDGFYTYPDFSPNTNSFKRYIRDHTAIVGIQPPKNDVAMIYPNGGENFQRTALNIQWNYTGPLSKELYFKLEYTTNSGVDWKLIKSDIDITSTNYYWNPTVNSSKYRFRIRVYNDNYFEEDASNSDVSILSVPTIKTPIFSFDNKVCLKWTKAFGATSYKIYRYKEQDNPEFRTETTNDFYFDDSYSPKNTEYTYFVKAIFSDGGSVDSKYEKVIIDDKKYEWTRRKGIPWYFDLNDMNCNSNTGVAVGNYGYSLYTENSGTSWNVKYINVLHHFYGVNFFDNNQWMAVGSGGVVYNSTNNGKDWEPKTSIPNHDLYDVYFSSYNNGWVVGSGGLISKTTNRGGIWQNQSSGVTNNLKSIFFFDNFYGWACGDGSVILRTTDGGNTWVQQSSGVNANLESIYFKDKKYGYCVGSGGTILTTLDSGNTWTNNPIGSNYYRDCLISDGIFTVVGDNSIIVSNKNGNFAVEGNDNQYNLNAVDHFGSIRVACGVNTSIMTSKKYDCSVSETTPYTGGIASGFSSSEYDFENGYCGYLGGIGSGFSNSPEEFNNGYTVYLGGAGSGFDISKKGDIASSKVYSGGVGSGFDYTPKFYSYAAPITLISPENNSTDIKNDTILKWISPYLTTYSNVQVSSSPNFDQPIIDTLVYNSSECRVFLEGLAKRFYWRVQTHGFMGSSLWSAIWNYRTDGDLHTISLISGWNMISTYVEPEQKSMPTVWDAIKSTVTLVKNNAGQSYIPAYNINQIGNWSKYDAYQVNMKQTNTLTIEGTQLVPEDNPIALNSGWRMVSYLRNLPMPAPTALATLVSQNALTLAKNNAGQSYIPQYNINQIGSLQPGQGYQMYLSKNATLTYPANSSGRAEAGSEITPMPRVLIPSVSRTGNNAVLLVQNNSDNGDEIGIFNSSDELIGSGIFHNGIASVTIWGDDDYTETIDGAVINEELTIKNYDSKTGRLSEIELTDLDDIINDKKVDKLTYSKDAFLISGVKQNKENVDLHEFMVSPNPFSEELSIEFRTTQVSDVILVVYNLEGHLIQVLHEGLLAPSHHKFNFSPSMLSSGEYTVVLTIDNAKLMRKVMKLK